MRAPIAHVRPNRAPSGRTTEVVSGPDARLERGMVLAWFSLTLLVMLGFSGFGVDTSAAWFTSQRVQAAADAAALAGSVFLPSDITGARTEAKAVAAQNGFADGVSGYTKNSTVTVAQEPNPYRLRVTISYTTKTYFTWVFGVEQLTLTRYSVGEYQGPVPMGSPTNNLGNQPVGSGQTQWLSASPADISNTAPQVWANIAGPRTNKANGDRYTTDYCAAGTPTIHNCTGSGDGMNVEYQPSGYYFVIKVRAKSTNLSQRLRVEAYDAPFIQQGDTCNDFTAGGGSTQETTVRNELIALNVDRYSSPQPTPSGRPFNEPYCPGDNFIRSGQGVPTTSYDMKSADQTPWSNTDNPSITTSGCTATSFAPIEGRSSSNSARLSRLLNPSVTSTEATYAKATYHNWAPLCNATLSSLGITTAGEYDLLLNVRTSGGAGHNRFALRAGLSSTSTGTVSGADVSVYANGKLPIYANASGADSRFFLARVIPGNAGRTLSVQFFDTGDASAAGQITIVPPADAKVNGVTVTQFNGCKFVRLPDNASLSYTANGCILNNVAASAGYDGRTIIASVPIPVGYTCSDTLSTGCWVKVRFTYGTGVSVTDTTTWSANIMGDPVRLVE